MQQQIKQHDIESEISLSEMTDQRVVIKVIFKWFNIKFKYHFFFSRRYILKAILNFTRDYFHDLFRIYFLDWLFKVMYVTSNVQLK